MSMSVVKSCLQCSEGTIEIQKDSIHRSAKTDCRIQYNIRVREFDSAGLLDLVLNLK